MKKMLPLFLFFLSVLSQAQELVTHPLLPPESKEISDFEILNEDLQGKRVVMLGEMTHMYGNIFEMKSRVIEYLHQELGFTTIAMESSMYEFYVMDSENPEFNSKAFNRAIFGVWSQSQEFQRLVNYIEENNLKVIGFDSQIINHIQRFIEDFYRYCEEQNIDIKLNKDDFGIAIEDVMDVLIFEEEDLKYKTYEKELLRIIRAIEKLEPSEENKLWLQLTKGLLASSKSAYYNEDPILTSDMMNEQYNFRDAQMADNLLSYITTHPEEKIVVWADNVHVINNGKSITAPVVKDFVSMGTFIKKNLGDEVYSLATIHANDSLLEQTTWHSTPILKGSFEDKLAMKNEAFSFVSSNQPEMKKIQKHRLLSFIDFYDSNLSELYDGYIFLKSATLPKKDTLNSSLNNEYSTVKTEVEEEADDNFNEANFKKNLFKGLITDAQTNEPVAYATVVLNEEEIYRISDEKGEFEFKLNKITTSSKVNISSMGYEPLEIPLSNWKENIKLIPAFESLNTVVVVGYNRNPKKILKRAISELETNYPSVPLNYKRYGHYIINKNDTTYQDIEIVTKDYTPGYFQEGPAYERVEQAKWNKNKGNEVEYAARLIAFRENAIQFANVLHKRKYKKFDLEFIHSNKPEEQHLYIIKFTNNRDRFGFTNRWYPSNYSGEIYINKEDYAVVKVVENWENTALEKDMEKYEFWLGKFKDTLTFKFQYTSVFEKKEDQKYYATEFFVRSYQERTNMNGEFYNATLEGVSYLYDYTTKDIMVLEYDDRKYDSALKRVEYDKEFWQSFTPQIEYFRSQ